MPKLDLIALALAVFVAAVTILLSKSGQPSVESASGVYTSSCCGEIEIRPRQVRYAGSFTRIKFYHIKFGLTGYLEEPIGDFYRIANGKKHPAVQTSNGK